MRLAQLLSRARVLVPLQATTLEAATQLLLEACIADGCVSDVPRLERMVREARPEDTVSLGVGVLLPHFRTDAVPSLAVALGVAAVPLVPSGREGRAARVVLLLLAPPRDATAYLQAVAGFARALARPEVMIGLHQAALADDVLRLPALAEVELEGPLLVRDVMAPPAASIGADASLGEAARLLVLHEVEALPVVGDAGEVLGIVSHRELLRYLVPTYVQRAALGEARVGCVGGDSSAADPRALPVREVMRRSVLCLSEDQTIVDVAQLMTNKDVEHFPVVRDGVLCGVLTRADIVRKVVGSAHSPEEKLAWPSR